MLFAAIDTGKFALLGVLMLWLILRTVAYYWMRREVP